MIGKKSRCFLVLILSLCVLLPFFQPVNASDKLHERFTTNDNGTSFYGANWKCETFTIGNTGTNEKHNITSVKILIYRVNNPGTITVSIRATSSGSPTGGDLTSGTSDGNTLPTGSPYEWREFFLTPITLSASTTYAIIVRATTGDSSNYVNWRQDTRLGYTGGQRYDSSNSGSSWSLVSTRDLTFMEYGIKFNLAPVISNPIPANESIDVSLIPQLNITINDADGNKMTLDWSSNSSGSWVDFGKNVSCENGTYRWINSNFSDYSTTYYWRINVTDGTVTTSAIYHFTTRGPSYTIVLSNEDPVDGSTVIITLPTMYYNATNEFWLNITRSHSGGLDMNTTFWFDGSFLFTNITWGNGSILFNLFDYWSGPLVNGTVYNWTVNASDDWGFYCNETQDFLFIINTTCEASGTPLWVFRSRYPIVWILIFLVVFIATLIVTWKKNE